MNVEAFRTVRARLSRYRWLIVVILAGLALRLAFILLVPAQPVSDFKNYHDLAVNLLTYGTYGFGVTPSSHLAPGTSFFLALAYGVFRSTDIIYPKLIQAALGTADILLVYYIGRKAFNETAGLLAAAIWALFPTPIAYTAVLASENPFVFLCLLSISSLLTLGEKSRLDYALVFLAGAAAGLSALVRPAAIYLPVIFLACIPLKSGVKKAGLKRIALLSAVLLAGVLLAAGPWCLRNYAEFGHFGVSSNGGINAWMGNNAEGWGVYMDMGPLINETFPGTAGLSDFDRDALYSREAIKFMTADPVLTVKRDAYKLYTLYSTNNNSVIWSMAGEGAITDPGLGSYLTGLKPVLDNIFNWYYFVVLGLALAGVLALALRRGEYDGSAVVLLAAFVLYFSAVYAVTVVGDRYNFPMLPALAAFGAYGIVSIYDLTDKMMHNGDRQKREA